MDNYRAAKSEPCSSTWYPESNDSADAVAVSDVSIKTPCVHALRHLFLNL